MRATTSHRPETLPHEAQLVGSALDVGSRPTTLNVPPVEPHRPPRPTAPMSCDCHGAGNVGAGAGADTVTVMLAEVVVAPLLSVARAVRV